MIPSTALTQRLGQPAQFQSRKQRREADHFSRRDAKKLSLSALLVNAADKLAPQLGHLAKPMFVDLRDFRDRRVNRFVLTAERTFTPAQLLSSMPHQSGKKFFC